MCIATECPSPFATCSVFGTLPTYQCSTNSRTIPTTAVSAVMPLRRRRLSYTRNCSNGACIPLCQDGYSDCNAVPEDGCESDPKADSANCGICGHACRRRRASTGMRMSSRNDRLRGNLRRHLGGRRQLRCMRLPVRGQSADQRRRSAQQHVLRLPSRPVHDAALLPRRQRLLGRLQRRREGRWLRGRSVQPNLDNCGNAGISAIRPSNVSGRKRRGMDCQCKNGKHLRSGRVRMRRSRERSDELRLLRVLLPRREQRRRDVQPRAPRGQAPAGTCGLQRSLDDGREVDLRFDPRSCGSCGTTCDIAAGQPCVDSRCLTKACDADGGPVR